MVRAPVRPPASSLAIDEIDPADLIMMMIDPEQERKYSFRRLILKNLEPDLVLALSPGGEIVDHTSSCLEPLALSGAGAPTGSLIDAFGSRAGKSALRSLLPGDSPGSQRATKVLPVKLNGYQLTVVAASVLTGSGILHLVFVEPLDELSVEGSRGRKASSKPSSRLLRETAFALKVERQLRTVIEHHRSDRGRDRRPGCRGKGRIL
jgi:hypothetical protein